MFQLHFLSRNKHLSRKERYFRWGILGVCSAPLLGAYFYKQGWRIPFLCCPIRYLTGVPCPTCGMTRSFMAVAAGNWDRAFTQHLFGPFLFAICALAVIHIAVELKIGYQLNAVYLREARNRKNQITCLVLFLSYYALRLYFLSLTGEIYQTFSESPLGRVIISY